MKFSSLSCKILHFPKTTEMFVNLLISFWIYCGKEGKYHLASCIVYKKDVTWFRDYCTYSALVNIKTFILKTFTGAKKKKCFQAYFSYIFPKMRYKFQPETVNLEKVFQDIKIKQTDNPAAVFFSIFE